MSPCNQSKYFVEVSIIVPTINEYNNVQPAIDLVQSACSIAGISYEILFVDDQSSDGTPDLIRSIGQNDEKIRLIVNPERRGLGFALDCGSREARGTYICFLDCDCSIVSLDLSRLLSKREATKMIIGSRYLHESKIHGASWIKVVLSLILNQIVSLISRCGINDMSHSLRIFPSAFKYDYGIYTHPGFFWEMSLGFKSFGKLDEIPITFYERERGQTKNRSIKMVRSVLDFFLVSLISRK